MSHNGPHAPRGCAATPYNKKKVAVVGAGGYLGALIFGFLQRAASLYGTGVGGPGSSIPRCITSTATGSMALNRVLSKHFKLAFASENMVALTNMADAVSIASSMKDMDAVILGTQFQLEKRSVTGNTYETTPNDKTLEVYLDDCRGADSILIDDQERHLGFFERLIEACANSGVKHVVVLQTPLTQSPMKYLNILDCLEVPYTYILVEGAWKNANDFTFDRDLGERLVINNKPRFRSNGENSDFDQISEQLSGDETQGTKTVFREDIAALAVQCLLSLDWTTSRIIAANSRIADPKAEEPRIKEKPDKIWHRNSDLMARALTNVN